MKCEATTRDGERCQRTALGSGTCGVHGGYEPPPKPSLSKPCRCEPPIAVVRDRDPETGEDELRCAMCGRSPSSTIAGRSS